MNKFLLSLTIALIMLTFVSLWMTRGESTEAKHPAQQEGQAAIGGAFSLVDQNGRNVSDSDLRGKPMLVFFGYTHCPDICPVTVKTISDALDALGDKANGISSVFITVDPARDTPPVLKEYLANFNPHLLGLTGDPGKVKSVADAYKVYFAKKNIPWDDDADEHADADHHDDGHDADAHEHHHHHDMDMGAQGGDYEVDHSAFIYLMDKDGAYITHFPYDVSATELADAVSSHMQ